MRWTLVIGTFAAGLLFSACIEEEMVDGLFPLPEWEKVQRFSPLESTVLPSPTNRFANDDGAAALGQMLFFEKRYSGAITVDGPGQLGAPGETGKYSCADCHDSKRWFIDTRSQPGNISVGAAQLTKRNSPSMVNIAYYEWGGWAGAQDQFWKQGANSPETKDLAGDRLGIAHMIYEHYRAEYEAVFETVLDPALDPDDTSGRFPPNGKPNDPAWMGMSDGDRRIIDTILANVGKAFEAYERRLVSNNAPIDRYIGGDYIALNAKAKRGLKLFIGKAGCDSCHQDKTFTDQKFHNTGVPQMMSPMDLGRYDDVMRLQNPFNGAGEFSDDREAGAAKLDGITPTEEMKGQFRTKSLRHVAETGPFFHDGSVATLKDVVRFYNGGGGVDGTYPGVKSERIVPLNLSEGEIDDLVAFLEALTGEPVPEHLTVNTAKP